MKIIHSIYKKKIEKDVKENASFLLTNKLGGYCWLPSKSDSRYQGVFFNIDNRMYKVIEDIRIDAGTIDSLKNNFFSVERKRRDLIFSWFSFLVIRNGSTKSTKKR